MEAKIADAAEEAMTHPRRRRFAFSLRTMFVVVALAGVLLAWIGFLLNWIRDRERFAATRALEYWRDPSDKSSVAAPGCLWLFGEPGRGALLVLEPGDIEPDRRLFPEADVDLLGR